MKKLFDKDEIWFAILWIVIYVISFASADKLSIDIGIPKLITVIVGLVLSLILYSFINKYHLNRYYGLCRFKGKYGLYLYFIPLVIISSVNFWFGLNFDKSLLEVILYMISMIFVAFLEEVIFRGLLFKAMAKDGIKLAIIVSSLTFGMGHIINIFLGEALLETLLQLVYASAIGFVYTAIFYVSGSIMPCIISHSVVNMTSILANNVSAMTNIVVAVIQTILAITYGLYLLKRYEK